MQLNDYEKETHSHARQTSNEIPLCIDEDGDHEDNGHERGGGGGGGPRGFSLSERECWMVADAAAPGDDWWWWCGALGLCGTDGGCLVVVVEDPTPLNEFEWPTVMLRGAGTGKQISSTPLLLAKCNNINS